MIYTIDFQRDDGVLLVDLVLSLGCCWLMGNYDKPITKILARMAVADNLARKLESSKRQKWVLTKSKFCVIITFNYT